jgi:hypothetical protein
MMHDGAGTHLHCLICKAIGIEKTRETRTRTHTHIYTHIHTRARARARTHTHTKPVCENGDRGVLWNQETEFTANMPDIIIKHRKEKHVH